MRWTSTRPNKTTVNLIDRSCMMCNKLCELEFSQYFFFLLTSNQHFKDGTASLAIACSWTSRHRVHKGGNSCRVGDIEFFFLFQRTFIGLFKKMIYSIQTEFLNKLNFYLLLYFSVESLLESFLFLVNVISSCRLPKPAKSHQDKLKMLLLFFKEVEKKWKM